MSRDTIEMLQLSSLACLAFFLTALVVVIITVAIESVV
jgi:hypothetical protein